MRGVLLLLLLVSGAQSASEEAYPATSPAVHSPEFGKADEHAAHPTTAHSFLSRLPIGRADGSPDGLPVQFLTGMIAGVAAMCIVAHMFPGGGGGQGGGRANSRMPPAWSPDRESTYSFKHWTQDLLRGQSYLRIWNPHSRPVRSSYNWEDPPGSWYETLRTKKSPRADSQKDNPLTQ